MNNTREKCPACTATGDMIDDPLFIEECQECGADMCIRCGEVEGDPDGTMYWCKACYEGE